MPGDVADTMRAMLARGVREARRKQSPSDGYLRWLDLPDVAIRGGKFEEGGWDLQATHCRDSRIVEEGDYVTVHGYTAGANTTCASITALVERDESDLLEIEERELDGLLNMQAQVARDIAELRRGIRTRRRMLEQRTDAQAKSAIPDPSSGGV